MNRWDPRLRVVLAVAIGAVVYVLMTSLDGSRRLAAAELAAVPLFFALWLGASGLSNLFGAGEGRGADEDHDAPS